MAACGAAQRGRQVLLIEKNARPGVKISISGGGHCNLTHATDARGVAEAFGPAGRFLRSVLAVLDPPGLVEMIEAEGVPCRTEPDGKILPASDRADDVLDALLRRLSRSGATLQTSRTVIEIARDSSGFRVSTHPTPCKGAPDDCSVDSSDIETLWTDKIVLTTGGRSYPGCGTTGDGYAWAAAMGHTIQTPRPALVPITTDDAWVKSLQGITVPDMTLRVCSEGWTPSPPAPLPKGEGRNVRPVAERRGSLLFAHFGLSGPVALDLSRWVSAASRGHRPVLVCDFLPQLSDAALDAALAEAAAGEGRRLAASLLTHWLPGRLADALYQLAGLPPERRGAELTRSERLRLVRAVKHAAIATTGTLGFEKAEVTAGGISLDEIDSRSMQSKLVPGLFLAGELLDLDGPIGGFNLQAAFSTGHLAGQRV
ncbi:MAG: NAD(P)/FAD-dependent oxidoreductase [Pirellulales bacterium]|nr:NAD(P)/FAD-dependent oxidoreductase [Pirellulales bacterium]